MGAGTRADDMIELSLEGVVAVRIAIVGGEVAVTASGDDPGRLQAESLRGDPLDVRFEGGTLVVGYDSEPRTTIGGVGDREARVIVSVPATTPTDVRVVSAEVVIAGLAAEAEVRSVSGDLTVSGHRGRLVAHTVSGDVNARDVAGTIEARSVSGDVTISAGRLDRFDLKTVSGDATLDVDVDPSASVRVTSVSGDVAMRVPTGCGLDLDVTSMSGDVRASVPLADEERSRFRVRGRVGDGGAKVSVRSTSGDVLVLHRGDPA